MTSQGIVVQPGRMETGTDEFLTIDLLSPSFQVNKGLPAVKQIVDDGLNGIADSSLALWINGNEMVNQLGQAQFLE
ncbi:hypothetical protein GS8_1369 [Geobacillus stearothermophilus]|uniref:Uncharacterized protein n=1 Tax=Geobacillus stearothermophilus TaxID=1422 RepID=A0ABQ7HGI1_GEOSE|nr:hypothetical protein GS8_1369 [Geobacillus stearothermophilus]